MVSPADILGARILIVDDREANILLLERTLRGAGYLSIESTTQSQDVVRLYRKDPYDLVILDLQMPVMDGFQVLEALKEVETAGYLPVLVITGQPGHKIRALQAGAKDFIGKPLDLAEVLLRVHNLVEVRLLHTEQKKHRELLEEAVRERTAHLRRSEERFRSLMELSSDWYWEQDDRQRFSAVVGRGLETAGIPAGLVVGKALWEIEGVRWSEPERIALVAAIAARRPFHDFIFASVHPDGSFRYFEICGEPIADQTFAGGYRGTGREVTDRMRREEALRRFRTVIDATADGIFVTDRATMRILDANHTACRMLGYAREELLGLGPEALGHGTREELAATYDALIAAGVDPPMVEVQLRRKDGSPLPVEIARRVLRSGDGWIVVAVARDVTERKVADERLRHAAEHDPLTGLPNRAQFRRSLERAIVQAAEHGGGVSALLLDLDGFKGVNDSLGHAGGDLVLREVGCRLARCARVGDTVGRLGADELGLLVVGPVEDAESVLGRVREALREPLVVEEREVSTTASIGIATYPEDSPDADRLIRYAEEAMRAARETGPDAYRFHAPARNVRAIERLDLEKALREAISRGELVLHYQPQVHVGSGDWTGLEALIRWNRPGHGPVSPAVFVPVLEETGLIVRVGTWVLGEACRQIRAWTRSGIAPVRVAVNVSARQLRGELAAAMGAAMKETGVGPHLLGVEVAESVLLSEGEAAVDVLRELKALGIEVSIDDFGTGASSLGSLTRFPIDKVKIDVAFIRSLTTREGDAGITTAVIGMAHSLKLKVIAEGVETPEQRELLRGFGCDEIQGYLLAPPRPASELEWPGLLRSVVAKSVPKSLAEA